jgi:hypothetical protein
MNAAELAVRRERVFDTDAFLAAFEEMVRGLH